MIHSFDYPELAELALLRPAPTRRSLPRRRTRCTCRRTSSPAWECGTSPSSRISRRTARQQDWISKSNPGATAFDALHAMDYLEYAYLQTERMPRRKQ